MERSAILIGRFTAALLLVLGLSSAAFAADGKDAPAPQKAEADAKAAAPAMAKNDTAQPGKLPAGAVATACGCLAYSKPKEAFPKASCASGQAEAETCVGYCMRRGNPWQEVCK